MPLHDISTNKTTSDECNNDILSERPFLNIVIDSSSEYSDSDFTENLENENPFKDEFSIFTKRKLEISNEKPQSWNRKAFSLLKNNHLIRSTPQLSEGSFWNFANNGEQITLPTLGCGKSDSIKRISAYTLMCLSKKTLVRDYILIDARFKYEFEGGHILNAVNINNEADIYKLKEQEKQKILIFYCEFSSIRGPSLAKKLRNIDRHKNEYPKLDFPEIYVLEGGYRNFYENYPELCTPNCYIQMNDKRFKEECAYYHKRTKINKN